MSEKVVIISSSPRKNGNSAMLAKQFAKGASDAGSDVLSFDVNDIKPEFCRGCLYCQSHGDCVISDGMKEVVDCVQKADVLVFATPVYYYSVSGQLKTFLDRLNPLFTRKNNFKSVYLISTCADEDESAFDGTIKAVEGWIYGFEGVELKGKVLCGGVTAPGDIKGNQKLAEAYDAGNKI